MKVNFEFLDEEPIDNVITCLHYQMDKVVFFGYKEVIDKSQNMKKFLLSKCKVKTVSFVEMPKDNLETVYVKMKEEVEKEKDEELYFDLTGGEDLILVAFGMLAKEFDAPMHEYKVEMNQLIELTPKAKKQISKDVPKQRTVLMLDDYIKLQNGCINYRMHKDSKDLEEPQFCQRVEKLFVFSKKCGKDYNSLSSVFKNCFAYDTLSQCENKSHVDGKVAGFGIEVEKFVEMLKELEREQFINNLSITKNYKFEIESKRIQECLWDSGSALELHTYMKLKGNFDDIKVGVHLDWDGVIHQNTNAQGTTSGDVVNEIDVLAIRDAIPTFISCKNTKMNKDKPLHALYELEAVTDRFGGKYAKKKLCITQEMQPVYRQRAQEMGIKIITY